VRKLDADEAVPIVKAAMEKLLLIAPTKGRPGADLRRAIGNVLANVEIMLRHDTLGQPLLDCFEQAQLTGITQAQLELVRLVAEATTPVTLGAGLVKDSLIQLVLATEGSVIADMTFRSRDDVENLKIQMNDAFADVEESVADAGDSIVYRALVSMHAATVFHLIETARPLPRMLDYRFGMIFPTLKISHRLYTTADRADELRYENKIVHPAFCPLRGKALST
jgi:prophage DNA circulation protein